MRLRGKACIIGAGSSGIAACKVLKEHGLPFDCFEKSDRVGGNWVFGNKNGMSSAYRSLHINTSRDRMAYSDFPMPRDYPDFPHHSLIARYFDAYVDHFDVRKDIRFETSVESVTPDEKGGFRVLVKPENGPEEALHYEAVLVANGHHFCPRWPAPPFPGSFDGQVMHSHFYVDNQPFRDKRVVVLGMGNSAMDIAVECSQVAARVFLAARRGAYVVPKYLFGRPLDSYMTSPRWPFWVRTQVGKLLYKVAIGDLKRYGLPEPEHGPLSAHPTISSDIFTRLVSGDITTKPNLQKLLGDRVEFKDGSVEPVDAVIYCTGYNVSFPFFDAAYISAPENDLPLYRRVFHPDRPGIYFVGLLQPLGAIMPLAEAQSHLIAEHLRGEYELPPVAAMKRDMALESEERKRRYVASARHTMQVDFDRYLESLKLEKRRGKRRAKNQPHV